MLVCSLPPKSGGSCVPISANSVTSTNFEVFQIFAQLFTTMNPIKWFYNEFGLASIHKTGRNAYVIIFARFMRMIAHGAVTLILGTSSWL